jgi:uncharacterized protein
MQKIHLEIVGLTSGQTHGSYTLILGENEGNRKLPIIIGSFEAQAIAIEIEKIVPFRPMTHDLFISFSRTFNIDVTEIVIYNLVEGVFYSKIVCQMGNERHEIDARTSDAIALAVRFNCPITTFEHIMELAGITLQNEDEDEEPSRPAAPSHEEPVLKRAPSQNDFSHYSMTELEAMLDEAEQVEDYERAARIRDEIRKRK